MPWMFWGPLTGGAAVAAWGVYTLSHRPTRISWRVRRQTATAWITAFLTRLQARWRRTLPHAQAALRITSAQMIAQYAGAALLVTLALALIARVSPLLSLPLGAVSAWLLVPWVILRRYGQYQNQVASNLPTLVLLLQFYLSLDYPILQALQASLPAMGPFGQAEVTQIIGDLQHGENTGAFRASQSRIDRLYWRMLMDTLAQSWGHEMTGAALDPLTTMLRAQRDERARLLTSSVDAVSTAVPILAVMGGVIAFLFFLLASSLGGSL